MSQFNTEQYFLSKQKWKNKIFKEYNIKNESGIYIFYRHIAYIGKSSEKDGILGRCAGHCVGYSQHIDKSLKTRKLTCDGGQWKIKALCYCSENEVDDKERQFIEAYSKQGFELLNVENGGNAGKEDINKRAERKGYNQGKVYGYNKAIKEVAEFFEKYLTLSVKKENVICNRKLGQFKNLLIGDN